MGDSLGKVKTGDPLKIPAQTFNAFVDAARAHRQKLHTAGRQHKPRNRDNNIIRIRNDSGSDRERFDILGISNPLFLPSDDIDAFVNSFAVAGVVPVSPDHCGAFGILSGPIAAGEIGKAYISGSCPVKINVTDESHKFAEVAGGDCNCLASCENGSAAILWKETGTGQKWAIVRICAAGSESSGGTTSFPAKIISSLGNSVYTAKEQVMTSQIAFADKAGVENIQATNLAELSLGPGAAVNIGTIVLAAAVTDNGNPPITRYVFDHPAYAKYLD